MLPCYHEKEMRIDLPKRTNVLVTKMGIPITFGRFSLTSCCVSKTGSQGKSQQDTDSMCSKAKENVLAIINWSLNVGVNRT